MRQAAKDAVHILPVVLLVTGQRRQILCAAAIVQDRAKKTIARTIFTSGSVSFLVRSSTSTLSPDQDLRYTTLTNCIPSWIWKFMRICHVFLYKFYRRFPRLPDISRSISPPNDLVRYNQIISLLEAVTTFLAMKGTPDTSFTWCVRKGGIGGVEVRGGEEPVTGQGGKGGAFADGTHTAPSSPSHVVAKLPSDR